MISDVDVMHVGFGFALMFMALVRIAVAQKHIAIENDPGEQQQQRKIACVPVIARSEHEFVRCLREISTGSQHHKITAKTTPRIVPTTCTAAETANSFGWLRGTLPIVSPVRALTAT